MAQNLVHCDSAFLNAEQFGTILHWGVMKWKPFHRFAPLRSQRGQVDYAEFSRQKGRDNPARVSLGGNNILT